MSQRTSLAASVQAKKGRLYAVIQTKENGKSKSVWRSLGLDEGANKTTVSKTFRRVVTEYEEEYNKRLLRGGKPDADIPIFPFLCSYLEKAKQHLQVSTYRSYHQMIYGRIQQYFSKRNHLTVENIKPKDIEDFYDWIFESGVKANTVIHYHVVLHRAFQQAFKDELIDVNPFDRVERPKKNKFQGANYSEDELIALFELSRTDPIWSAIVLAGGMGLRRSEALGVRWSRIDMEQRTMLLDTKIVEDEQDGKIVLLAVEEMKNKTSRRTLPIPDPVYEMLETVKTKQEINRRLFRGSYNREWDDYVCTDDLGNMLKPNYLTEHFSTLLKKLGLRHIRFHDLRHTFASVLINKEVPLINVSSFLGHSTISTTANIYAHLDKTAKQNSANVISDIFRKEKI
ncbi:MAG: site-specific integrase [Clostridia bacterium]|nr:site-specific integrase [Clostridia bacterium]